MRLFLGFVLGVVLTIAGAYLYDTASGRALNGLSPAVAGNPPPMVNWDVVSASWQNLQSSVRTTTGNIEKSLKGHTG
jgi:hypothetical protein